MILKGLNAIQDDPKACQDWLDHPWHVVHVHNTLGVIEIIYDLV